MTEEQEIAQLIREAVLEERRACADMQDCLLKELRHFFSLPNWENRSGTWRDINDGLRRVAAALKEIEQQILARKDGDRCDEK